MKASSIFRKGRCLFSGSMIACLFALVVGSRAAAPAANDGTDIETGPQLVDWTPGSAWRNWTAKFAGKSHPTKFAPPAFGRDQLKVQGARKRRGEIRKPFHKGASSTTTLMHAATLQTATLAAEVSGTLGLGEQDTPYIEDLAYGLGYDPLRIYNWVRTHVEYVPYNGLVKGAHVTAIERRGNDYDQCVLLVSLLKQCSTVSSTDVGYLEADVTYTNSELSDWIGWDPSATSSDPLTAAHIDNTIESGVVVMHRVLVTLSLNGATYVLDPAYKHMTRATPLHVSDLVPTYSAGTISGQAGGNAPSTDEYSGPNVDAFDAALSSVTTSYVRAANQFYRDRDARSLLGLPVIAEAAATALPSLAAEKYTTVASWTAIPEDRSLDLTIQMGSKSNTITYHWCNLANDVFSIAFDSAGRASLYRESQLELTEDGTPSGNFVIQGTRSYPGAKTGDPVRLAPFTATAMSRSGRSVMYPSFDSSAGRLTEISRIQADDFQADPASDATLVETLALAAAQRAVHEENYGNVVASVADRISIDSGSMWFVHARGQNLATWWTDGPSVLIATFELRDSIVPFSRYWEMMWPFASATEALSLEELSHANGGSTTTVMASALRQTKYSIYRLNTNNYASMIGRIDGGILPGVKARIDAGSEAFVPSAYYIPIYGNTNLQCGAACCAVPPVAGGNLNFWMSASWLISGGYNGGVQTESGNNPVSASGATAASQNVQSAQGTPKGADPVDLTTGAFTYESEGLKVGNGSEPTSLDFREFYNTTLRNQDTGHLGRGWSHSYDMFVSIRDAADVDLRTATVAEVAPMVVMAQYLSDIITSDPTAKEFSLRCLAGAWAAEQFRDAQAVASLGKTRIQFDRLPDGSYLQSSSVPATLTKGTDGTYSLAFRHGNTVAFRASDGKATSITDQYGNVTTLSYSGGLLTQVADAYGRTLTFAYNGTQLSSVTDSTGRHINFGYGANFTIQDPDGGIASYEINANRELVNVFDARGRTVITNLWDDLHRVWAQQLFGDGTKTTYLGYAPGSAYEEDAFGLTAWTILDDRRRRVAYMNQDGKTTKWTYDGADRLTKEEKPAILDPDKSTPGNPVYTSPTTTYIYDAQDNLLSITDPLGHVRSITPDANSRPWKVANFEGQITEFLYNAQHSITSITRPGSITDTFTYDAHGRVYTEHPAAYASGEVRTYTYDATGGLQTITYPGNSTESYTCDALGNVKTFVDRNNHKTTYEYNNRREVTSVTHWDGATSYTDQIEYDAVGDKKSDIDADGLRTDFEHDPMGHLLTVKKGPSGSQITVLTNEYNDPRELLSNVTDGLGHGILYSYNDDQRISESIDSLNRHTKLDYDNDGNPATTTTPLLFATTVLFDAKGFKQAVTDAENHTWDYTYDKDGRPATLSNRLNHTFMWSYDDPNRTVTFKTPLQRTTVSVATARGLPQSIAKPSDAPNAPSVTFDSYDAEGRLTQKTDGVGVTSYAYYPNGLLHTVTENNHTTTRVYDAFDRLSQYSDGEGNTIGYDYYPSGRLHHLTYPGGRQVAYAYDALGRLHTVTDWANRVTTYTYDNASRLTRLDRPNGTYRMLTYDAANELTDIAEYLPDGTMFYYEKLGHDDDSRVTSISQFPKVSWAALPTDSTTYDADNQLETWNGQSVTFDANGNMTNGPLPSGTFGTYVYDARNRLTSDGGSSYRYNPDGLRVEVTGAGAETLVVDPNAALSRVLMRTTGGATTYYVYGLGLLYEDTNGSAKQYHFDHSGSTIALTDGSAAATDRWIYGSFGVVQFRQGSTSTPFQFNGDSGVETDSSGLLYMRARYYNPRIMRFLNADPIQFDGGMNWYAYCGDNPISRADPQGLWFGIDDAVFAGGGAIIGAGGALVADWITGTPITWQGIAGAAAGGAAGGETLLYTVNPVAAGAVGGAVSNGVTQGLNIATGRQHGFNYGSLAQDTIIGAGTGLIPGAEVAGISSGRGSASAVFKQIVTKAENGTIRSVTAKTAVKMGVGAAIDTAMVEGATFGPYLSNVFSSEFGSHSNDEYGPAVVVAPFVVTASRK